MTNLLIALKNIITNPITDLVSLYSGSNRINNVGESLEMYIKDVFCGSLGITDTNEKDKIHSNNFSYLGNTSNPPDIIIKNGDAIEVKKIESFESSLALNSSFPKHKLHSDDPRITAACKGCEEEPWAEKDIIYTVGVASSDEQKIKSLWFVYGDCYCAKREIYMRVSDTISQGIREIPGVEFTDTNELAKVKKVDPLGITGLRVRGMWHIENPTKVFRNLGIIDRNKNLTVTALILEEKYTNFPEEDRVNIEKLQNEDFKIIDVEIKSPDNPAKLVKAKLIHYAK